MERILLKDLKVWLTSTDRKPLVLRGARQVGKTWLTRHLAEASGKQLIEINFEKQPSATSLFATNDPRQILLNLSTILNQQVDPATCLLFLDEIQAAPQIFSKLRWFAEDLPQLAVIAAGSLLDLVIGNEPFNVPVGRISYMYLYPLSFEEYLLANDKKSFYDYLVNYDLEKEIPSIIDKELKTLFNEYLLVGGLPAAVSSWITQRSLNKISQIQNDLISTYRDDFAKYKGRITTERFEEVMMAIPKMLGNKFTFSNVNKNVSSATIKQVLFLLEKAGICHHIQSCSANGVPLKAEINEKYFKEIFLDIGLCSTILGLNLNEINAANNIVMINKGGIAEQVVGQLLRTVNPPYIEPSLFYWHRDEPGSNAEVDFVIQHGSQVVAIEVKAGSTGSLKSLHLFMGLKKFPIAIRINSDMPTKTNVDVKDSHGNQVRYLLISLPFYLVGQIHRLLNSTGS